MNRTFAPLVLSTAAIALLASCAASVQAPVASIAPMPEAVNAGSIVQLDGSGSHDPQSHYLTFNWSFTDRPLGSTAAFTDPNTAKPSFLADLPGEYQVSLTVSNSVLTSRAAATVTVKVSDCAANPPVIKAIQPSRTTTNIGDSVRFSAEVEDADSLAPCNLDQTFTYAWLLAQQPEGSRAFLNSERSETPSLTADRAGEYVLRLIVTDSTGRASDPGTFTLDVAECGGATPAVAPTATPETTHPNAEVQLDADVTDADEDCGASQTRTVQWSIRSKPDGSAAALSNSRAESPTFTASKTGAYELGVVATDSTGRSSDVGIVNVIVDSCGDLPPTVEAITVVSGAEGDPPEGTVGTRMTVQAVDVSSLNCLATGTPATEWSLAVPSGSHVALSNPAAASPSFTPDVSGDYLVSVRVRDSLGIRSEPVFLGVSVADCTPEPVEFGTPAISAVATDPDPSAPAFTEDGNPKPHVGALVTLTPNATVASYCGSIAVTPLSYRWTITSRPAGSHAALDSAEAQSPGLRIDRNGTYGFSVIATDARGNQSTPQTIELNTSSCGVNPITTALLTGAGRPLVTTPQAPASVASFAPFTIAAEIESEDNERASCPARFELSPGFSYGIEIEPSAGAATLSNVFGDSTVFEAHRAGSYAVHVDGAVTNLAGRVHALPAFAYLSVAACSSPVLSNARFTANGAATAFKGDRVDLAVDATIGSCGAISAALTYSWTLVAPVGSAASLSFPNSAAPSFVADAFGSFVASVTVTDAQGNISNSATVIVTVSTCGSSPILAVISDLPGALAFDDHVFTAVPANGSNFSADEVAGCPARFVTYSFAWSVVSSAPSTGFTLSSPAGSSVSFTPGGTAVYSVRLVVSSSTQRTEVTRQVTVACADVAPKVGPIFLASSTPGYPAGTFFRDDVVTLSASPSSLCFSPGSTAYAYRWEIVSSPPGSSSALSSLTTATPSFLADVARGTWTISAYVVDKLGNRSGTTTRTFKSEPCGLNPVDVTVVAAPGAKPMDPWTLTAVPASGSFFSNDSDPAFCPARFAPTYTFAWSASASTPPAKFVTDTTNPTLFAPGNHQLYTVHVVVSGNGQSGSADQSVDASCGAPLVSTPVVSLVNGVAPTGTVFVGDVVEVATPVTSHCFSAPVLSYAYTLSLDPGPATETFSPSPNAAQPSFVPKSFGGVYAVSVAVSDQTGQTGSPAAPLSISLSTCGSASVTSTYVAEQRFAGIVQQQPGSGTTTAPLTITLNPRSQTPLTTLVVEGAQRTFAVPFYLDREISVKVTLAFPAGCSSVQFTGAQLLDATLTPVPQDRFTSPPTGTVTSGQSLNFTFTARIGDVTVGSDTSPGLYTLKMFTTSGGANAPLEDIVRPDPIRVGGRCGLNAPGVNATFAPPSPSPAPVLVVATADPHDDDNATLVFHPPPAPAPDPGTSDGCGLDQSFSYLWTFVSKPNTSPAVFAPPDAKVSRFTADLVGNYEIELVVGDGTTSGANGDGKNSDQFLYER